MTQSKLTDMNRSGRAWLSWSVALVVSMGSILTAPLAAFAAASCQTSGPGAYSVDVCFESPAFGSTVTGPTQIDMSVTVTGPDPGTAKLLVYLDGEYLLTEYELPFTFDLPTADMADGARVLEVEAKMRDDFLTARAALTLNLSNGNATDPINTSTFTPATGSSPAPGQPFVLAAGGDGAAGRSEGDDVVGLIEGWNPNMFLYLGDVYDKGTYTEFFNWYGDGNSKWGRFRSITNPSIGNHEYNQDGYAYYWDNVPNYYSFDANGWHFLSLDIQEGNVSSTQTAWITSDLASSTAQCTVAFFHAPVVSLGPHGSTPELDSLWALLVDNGVDIVLTAHEHNYQRFLAMDRDLQADPAGVPQFIVGASGHGIRPTTDTDSRAAFYADTNPGSFGALKLELNSDGAAFRYINTDSFVLDSGTIPCSGPGPDTTPPAPPANATGSAGTQLNVDLTWDAATDNVGVETYRVYRNSTLLAEVDGSIVNFTDAPVPADTTYTYEITAVDLAQNESSPSPSVIVTTPPPPSSLTFVAEADAYVSDSDPSTNYGSVGEFKIDQSPLRRAFIRFDVSATTGPITSATLRLYGLSNHTQGFEVWSVADNSWVEATITHSSAPAADTLIGSSGSVTSLSYVDIDVSSAVSTEGLHSFALLPLNSTNLRLASRETTTPPELLVDMDTGSNTAPVAVDDSGSTPEDTGVVVDVLANDSDPEGDPLTVDSVTQPTNGAVVDNGDGTVTYTPDPDYVGADSFDYTVSDGALTDTGSVSVAVTAVNDPPVAVDDSGSTPEDTAVIIDVLGNDTDPDGDPLTVDSVTQPTNGAVVDNGDGTVTYTPNAGFLGADSFDYTVTDGVLIDTGTVSITVTAANDPPVAVDDSASTAEDDAVVVDVLVNDTDPNGDPLSVLSTGLATNGAVVDNGDGTVTYTPDPDYVGADSFEYTVSDGALTDTGTVSVAVTAVNDPPVAVDDSASTPEDAAAIIDVLGNDTDPDGDPLTVDSVTQPTNGAVVDNGDGTVTYTPDAGFSGADSFDYTVTDGTLTDTGTVSVTVTASGGTVVVEPIGDSYVTSNAPANNYGTSSQLRVDGSPLIRSFLLFDVTGLQGTVTSATLRLSVRSNHSSGFEVFGVADTTWDELTITDSNAPTVDAASVGLSGPLTSGTFVDIDVTTLVTGNGRVSLALLALNNTNLRLDSRDTTDPPQLTIQTK